MSSQAKQDISSLSGREVARWEAVSIEGGKVGERGRSERTMIVPLARSLAILEAFTPQEPWLGNQELVHETGIPAPTVSRMLRSLVALGYLRYSPEHRKYRLAAPVLSLGYAAIAHSNVQLLARLEMQSFANASETYVVLGTRDRLDVIVLETCASKPASLDLKLGAGTRLRIASSPMGWALLAALPELERFYLLGNVERKAGRDWPHLRRRISEGISQVHNVGYCMSLGEWEPDLTILAAPLIIQDHTPLVLACIGRSVKLGRARVERELGPRLVAAAQSLQEQAVLMD
ncbi:DNA-binding IclR family transcriptional regulator [Paraburkholderia sp. WC7.3g]|uniref:Helix-turn-helix domain-containing protein n=1 Tax=Paraburkholderia podalyriae TaxID=1938811 RepID=A0ABR7PHZ7_9BURK|nr:MULTISPECIES: helix-turn-helix domain-containing protein [Paraburkholderia]MBB5406405.1 DNA-binding IclR family transcriptional regulator [Paraburkholderia sp. HC6.4b]MBB5448803.1 DNA-binding IclR family transcriptional regulator [Paraburkholderia sp. Kb1A]MBC8746007.1 helix-turn-helix domain-containing protein [Paraburkholderia podalyriae]